MSVTAELIQELVAREVSGVHDSRVREHIQGLLVTPTVRPRLWDYGEPDIWYECWDVLKERASAIGIAYSTMGFGPRCPWGLVRMTGTDAELSMGMDCGWFRCFMEAYFESAAADLPIWRVFRQAGDEPYPGTPVTAESDWDSVWEIVLRRRSSDETARYHCHHSVSWTRCEW